MEHAKTCVLNGKLHVYYADESQGVGVIFNNIFQLMGLIADGQYMSVDALSDNEKVGRIGCDFEVRLIFPTSCRGSGAQVGLRKCFGLRGRYCTTLAWYGSPLQEDVPFGVPLQSEESKKDFSINDM